MTSNDLFFLVVVLAPIAVAALWRASETRPALDDEAMNRFSTRALLATAAGLFVALIIIAVLP